MPLSYAKRLPYIPMAQAYMPTLAGQVLNIGGGATNTTSLLELLDLITETHGQEPLVQCAAWRPGDQKYYASDIRRFSSATGWRPQVRVRQGVEALYAWLLQRHAGDADPLQVMTEVRPTV